MSGDGSVTAVWGGEERRFRLAIGQLRELQESINRTRGDRPIGPWSLLQLVIKGDAWPDDLREVLRLGLLGGGTKPHLVPGLLKTYFDEQPLLRACPTAMLILTAALIGDESDPVGKKNSSEGETAEPMFSSSQPSTDQAQQWASRLDKSMNAPSGNSQHASKDITEPTAEATTTSRTQ